MSATPSTTQAGEGAGRRIRLRNRYGFGIGTIGRDAAYTLVSMFLLFYLSDILEVSTGVFAAITVALVALRVFDAVLDPFVGVLVDNTHSRWGKFKPWILVGVLLNVGLMTVLFAPLPLGDVAFVAVFTVVYLAWSVAFAANDIGYWSMLPALTQEQREREKIGSIARICASIGTFTMVVAIVPVSEAIGAAIGDLRWSYFVVAVAVGALTILLQCVMLLLTREDRTIVTRSHTRFRELVTVIFRNDQLLAVAVAFLLFMVAFTITTSFGVYYFTYVYADADMYSVFALVLGVSQITALALYPAIAARISRRRLFTIALAVVAAGYLLFFLTPPGGLALIVVAGVAVFAAQAMIQVQLLMFIADTVEYGEHKLGRRNDSVTLSLQPFIYKLSSALASGVVGWTVIASGMKDADAAADMTEGGTFLVKLMMFVVPGVLIALSYLVYRRWYRLDAAGYARIVEELRARREAAASADADA
ncbi:glycoside-pentoside-hexuronide (GPH):cation symporter [Protaetiibacter intestinalis]|uniref:MFS transporter n=1 Tax=Protaetiibacter intestinalis TaxID=2419774 RepID=A0A387B7R3_9MICO|nr:glycoside-pentoside-hexuronide (GPH):cation symporter [Protaetiibacter intestinalis]AYF98383.1 MFS transporter [Protaetiibacter intestinalis]